MLTDREKNEFDIRNGYIAKKYGLERDQVKRIRSMVLGKGYSRENIIEHFRQSIAWREEVAEKKRFWAVKRKDPIIANKIHMDYVQTVEGTESRKKLLEIIETVSDEIWKGITMPTEQVNQEMKF